MNLKTLLIIKAIVCLLGVPVLLWTVPFYGLFGVELDAEGVYPAWQYGSSLIGILLLCWFARNVTGFEMRRAIIIGLFVYDLLGFAVTLYALLTNAVGALGWIIAGIYLLLTLGFGYFLLTLKKTA